MQQLSFKWRSLAVAGLVVAAALVMIGLGFWQLDRLGQRRTANALINARLAQAPIDLNSQTRPDLPEYQPVEADGTYDYANEIVLRNRTHLEAPGVHVLTPLRLAGRDETVLIDRGWIPFLLSEPEARKAFQLPAGDVTVSGILRRSQQRSFTFLPADPTRSPENPRLDAWYWVNIAEIQAQIPYPLAPFFIEAAQAPGASQPPISGYDLDLTEGPHLAYAIQWWAFSAILIVGSLALWRQRRMK